MCSWHPAAVDRESGRRRNTTRKDDLNRRNDVRTDRRFTAVSAVIGDVFRNPSANREAALLVFGSLFLLIVLIGLVVSLIVMSPRGAARPIAAGTGRPRKRRTPAEVRSRVLGSVATLVIVLAAVWATAGVTTSARVACESCHADSPHAGSAEIDAHEAVACVSCHETGGVIARASGNLSARTAHYVQGVDGTSSGEYGTRISSAGCIGCHGAVLDTPTEDVTRGLRMSHAEPVAAGAECVDCHRLTGGVVSRRITGMNECLRCHDDAVASAACSTCHTGDPAVAIAAVESTATAYARDLVPEPRCDTCHDTAACDACHGISLPHTPEFKAAGHAMEGARDLWYNGGRTCEKCHYEGRRECTACHEQAFLAHGPDFRASHTQADPSGVGCTCHNRRSPVKGRNFCGVCHEQSSR